MTLGIRSAIVTGGAGFIGSHITEALVDRGCDTTVVDNLSSGHLENLDGLREKIKFIKGDIQDPALMEKTTSNCDVVFHQAAVVSVTQTVEDPMGSTRVNDLGTLNVLEACRRNKVRRVVLASSSAVYGDDPQLPKTEAMPPNPLSPYAVQKRTNEQYARLYHRLYGMPTVCLRYFNVYGPRQDPSSPYSGVISIMMQRAAAGSAATIYGDGRQTRDFVNVLDVVQANLLAAEHEAAAGQIFNVGTGTSIEVNTLWDKIASLAGCTKPATYAPPRPGDIIHSSAAIDKAQVHLCFKPSVVLEQGLAETFAWYQQK